MSHRQEGPPGIDRWGDETIHPGEIRNIRVSVSESYSGMDVRIPIQVRRGWTDGPTLFIAAALHGDEINGTGVIRQLIMDGTLELKRGNLILVPVLNLLAFDRHSRYLPDRRDLNRCFPGNPQGSLASRMAHRLFEEIVLRSDFGIDLHTASIRKTNFPNIRADLSIPQVARLAKAFGTELILDGPGSRGTLRREACAVGCPTIVYEGGEVWKVEPTIVESSIRGILNVLRELGMIAERPSEAASQAILRRTKWIRADRGGFLQFHVQPGQAVANRQPLATSTDLLGQEQDVLLAPYDGVILGMTTLPAVAPGEPVCHIGQLPPDVDVEKWQQDRARRSGLQGRLLDQLSTNVHVVERPEI